MDKNQIEKPHLDRAVALEREAQQFHSKGEVEKAFASYDKAAKFYRDGEEHLKSAMCFAAAATCWNIHTGRQPLRNAATRNHEAAREALKARNYDYARSLFYEAAILYEKDGDLESYSTCYLDSKRAARWYFWTAAFCPQRTAGFADLSSVTVLSRIKNFLLGVLNLAADIVWGFGERPFRMFVVIFFVVVLSALVYTHSHHYILMAGKASTISFSEALYFSLVTFATVGYGDYVPAGWVRFVAVGEALSAIFLVPLFLVALTRRYLRIDR